MADYSDLIARLEKAEGPESRLDREIFDAIGLAWLDASGLTASLDAAIALTEKMLPGCEWGAGRNPLGNDGWVGVRRGKDHHLFGGGTDRATPAIALLIATLKALQSLEQKDAA